MICKFPIWRWFPQVHGFRGAIDSFDEEGENRAIVLYDGFKPMFCRRDIGGTED